MLPPIDLEAAALRAREENPRCRAAEESLQGRPPALSRRSHHVFPSRWDEAVPQIDEAGREVYPFKGTLVTYYDLDAAACDGPRRALGHSKKVRSPRLALALAQPRAAPSLSPSRSPRPSSELLVAACLLIGSLSWPAAQWRRVGGRAHRPDDATRGELLPTPQAGVLTMAPLTMAPLPAAQAGVCP